VLKKRRATHDIPTYPASPSLSAEKYIIIGDDPNESAARSHGKFVKAYCPYLLNVPAAYYLKYNTKKNKNKKINKL
jgi:hypothetical protein